jgi:mono/diheme cytochrome c family protein
VCDSNFSTRLANNALKAICAAPLLLLFATLPGAAATTTGAATAASERAVVDKYCVGCHNQKIKTANLELDKLDMTHLADHAEIGEKVIRKLRAHMMPPSGMPQPNDATRDGLITWMESELDHSAKTYLPPPGLHRMNRVEYTNAVRDVLGLQVDASKFLPADDSTHGFDNIAGALTLSPALMEAYLSAAGKISRLAVGDVSAPSQQVFEVPSDTAQNYHIEGLPFGTRGGILIKYQFPADGEYTFKVKGVTGYFQAVLGGVKGEKLEVDVDGERVHLFDWDKEISNTTGNGRATPRIKVKAGLHTVGVTFLTTNDIPGSELNVPFNRTMNTPGSIPGYQFYPHVGQVWIEGPYNPKGAPETLARQKIFVCHPGGAKEEEPCARQIVTTLAKHAYRRPPSAADVAPLMEFYHSGRAGGGSFDDGIESALQRLLADPEFVYRDEPEPTTLANGKTYRLSDLALASRLSFFLWSSVPDDELIEVAAKGQLKDPVVLEKQVRRMLADPKSASLVDNFTGQWLGVRSLKTAEPVVNLFPDYDDNLRNAYQQEVELFFASIMREDRSILDLLNANYTFVNERLAKQYGIPNIYGPQFRRVDLPADLDMRRGLLGKGALLTVTSNAARTSPVARGKWYLQTFLGVSPPDPPPNVPVIKDKAPDATGNTHIPTMRETMEMHHTNPTCASCHKIFEPIGLSLENFDAVGTWRTQDGDTPIDASGVLVDGTKINGLADLRASLMARSDQFARVVTEKMMTYALGRGVEYEDMPMLRSIVRDSAPGKYRFTSIVMGIVKSAPFQSSMKTVETSAKPATTATPVARALVPAASALMPAKAVKR